MVPSKLGLLANHSLPIDRLQTHRQNYSGSSYKVLLAPASLKFRCEYLCSCILVLVTAAC